MVRFEIFLPVGDVTWCLGFASHANRNSPVCFQQSWTCLDEANSCSTEGRTQGVWMFTTSMTRKHRQAGLLLLQNARVTRTNIFDQQGAVTIAFFPGEIVQAQHVRGLALGNIRAADEPQERIATGRHRQALRQLRPRFASLREGDLGEGLGLAQGSPGVGAREHWEAFRKGGARTPLGAARKAAHL
jgi:hypothetical protein